MVWRQIAFANLVDPVIVPSLPFASQPILIAGLASIPSQSSQSSNQRPVQAADWREFEICSEALQKIQTRWRGVGWLVSTLHSRARNEQDVDLSSSGSAEVSTADNSLMNKLLVKKSEPDLLSNPCRSNLNENHNCGSFCLSSLSFSGLFCWKEKLNSIIFWHQLLGLPLLELFMNLQVVDYRSYISQQDVALIVSA